MHTYRKQGSVWTVGFEMPHESVDDWREIRDFNTESSAAAFTSYLNGGQRPAWISVDATPEERDVFRAEDH